LLGDKRLPDSRQIYLSIFIPLIILFLLILVFSVATLDFFDFAVHHLKIEAIFERK